MTTDEKIIDEKIQYYINRETANISAVSSSKIDKCEYFVGKKYCYMTKVG